MNGIGVVQKGEAEKNIDFCLDYHFEVTSDTIVSSSWACSSADIMINSSVFDNSKTQVFVSGGVLGSSYQLVNTIVTNRQQTFVRTIILEIIRT